MSTELAQQNDCTSLRIRGPVRLGEVTELLEHARAASALGLPVEIDLGEAEHMHTAAWQVLTALEKDLQRQGHALRITKVSETIRATLEMLDKSTWLPRREDDD